MLVDRDITTPYDDSNIAELQHILIKIKEETEAILQDDRVAGLQ